MAMTAGLFATALVLAACGGDGGGDGEQTAGPTGETGGGATGQTGGAPTGETDGGATGGPP